MLTGAEEANRPAGNTRSERARLRRPEEPARAPMLRLNTQRTTNCHTPVQADAEVGPRLDRRMKVKVAALPTGSGDDLEDGFGRAASAAGNEGDSGQAGFPRRAEET
ncbi:hypothetical protein OG511_42280 [Streptomyces sp. NBC_01453]|uniref:hypothetical protein n=1 Tax=Streptomyces sp. NBC_01453 TaxID=2903873 RepID=UPI002E2CD7E5|nr:hypothetical protein [Streptomyces sp. NBC_01453]